MYGCACGWPWITGWGWRVRAAWWTWPWKAGRTTCRWRQSTVRTKFVEKNTAGRGYHGRQNTGLQRAVRLCASAQPLHGVHYVRLLLAEGGSEVRDPLRAFIHAPEDVGKSQQGLHARVPRHRFRRAHRVLAAELGVRPRPLRGLAHVLGVRRSDQDVGQHRIRVKRDRREQGIELRLVVHPRLRVGGKLPGGDGGEKYQCDPAGQGACHVAN